MSGSHLLSSVPRWTEGTSKCSPVKTEDGSHRTIGTTAEYTSIVTPRRDVGQGTPSSLPSDDYGVATVPEVPTKVPELSREVVRVKGCHRRVPRGGWDVSHGLGSYSSGRDASRSVCVDFPRTGTRVGERLETGDWGQCLSDRTGRSDYFYCSSFNRDTGQRRLPTPHNRDSSPGGRDHRGVLLGTQDDSSQRDPLLSPSDRTRHWGGVRQGATNDPLAETLKRLLFGLSRSDLGVRESPPVLRTVTTPLSRWERTSPLDSEETEVGTG